MPDPLTPPDLPKAFPEVLQEETAELRLRRDSLFPGQIPLPAPDPGPSHPYAEAHRLRPLGVCLSGGGIRSATFNLGVLQGMCEAGLLPYIDYLSTVSGGGYIGSWLHGVILNKHAGRPEPAQAELQPQGVPGEAEDDPITFLRKYSNYLAPRLGLFSPDFWTIAAVWLRNMNLNLLILIPFLAGIVLFVLMGGMLQQAFQATKEGHSAFTRHLPWVVPLAVAVAIVGTNLRDVVVRLGDKNAHPESAWSARWVINLASFCILLACYILGVGDFEPRHDAALAAERSGVLLFVLFFCLQWIGGFPKCFHSRHRGQTGLFVTLIVFIPAVCAAVTEFLILGVFHVTASWTSPDVEWKTLTLGPPMMVLVLMSGITLQIGLMGSDFPDGAREWLARLGAILTIGVTAWIGVLGLSVFGPYWAAILTLTYLPAGIALAGGWIATGAGGYLSGASDKTTGAPLSTQETASGWALELIGKVAPTLFMAGFLLLVSMGAHLAIRKMAAGQIKIDSTCLKQAPTGAPAWLVWLEPVQQEYWCVLDLRGEDMPWSQSPVFLAALILFATCASIVFILPLRFNINEFSLHHFYKNRLVRCYLGAGKAKTREPNPLTGFDPWDDFRLAGLRASQNYLGPYPIVNCALNLNTGSELAQQERQGSSFFFSPLYSGFEPARSKQDKKETQATADLHPNGYRWTTGYVEPDGPGLGMTMAISGAAANPNDGYHTSAPLAFMMTIFDVRLGWWLGNPRRDGPSKRPGPMNALISLLSELFAQTNGRSKYVNVSDGGHFENLGLYELVRRRCRYIIACDAEEDPKYTFESLGGAIRKCRTDFGVEIDVDPEPIRLRPDGKFSGAHCVIGTITYPEREAGHAAEMCDGEVRRNRQDLPAKGWILYFKSSLTGDEPEDVQEYKAGHATFPQESTADQFFTESQFESYRQLGLHVFRTAFENVHKRPCRKHESGMLDMFQDLSRKWYPEPRQPGASASNLTERYTALMQRLSAAPELQYLDADLFPGRPVVKLSDDPAVQRKAFFFCMDLTQLMEDVYTELGLQSKTVRENPQYGGWMDVFRKWARSPSLYEAWQLSKTGYNPLFQEFFEEMHR